MVSVATVVGFHQIPHSGRQVECYLRPGVPRVVNIDLIRSMRDI